MVRVLLASIGVLLLVGCDPKPPEEQTVVIEPRPPIVLSDEPGAPLPFPMVEDNVKHDTLLVQVTFDAGDGTFLMVASNVTETFEGLRLYRYRALPDSSALIISASSPAYDSWTMLPTFFGPRATLDSTWTLANFGERESWGQKVLWSHGGFTDRGFLHVALPERITENDSTFLRRTNVAPHMRWATSGDTTVFTFACDSVFLYDDELGATDIILPGKSLRYTLHPAAGLELWVNGQRRAVKQPA